MLVMSVKAREEARYGCRSCSSLFERGRTSRGRES